MGQNNNQKRGRKFGRMLRKAAFKRYWSPFNKGGVYYQHRLEFNKVKGLVSSGRFKNEREATDWWRANRKRHNKKQFVE